MTNAALTSSPITVNLINRAVVGKIPFTFAVSNANCSSNDKVDAVNVKEKYSLQKLAQARIPLMYSIVMALSGHGEEVWRVN